MIPSLPNAISTSTQGSSPTLNQLRTSVDGSRLLQALSQPDSLPSLMVGELLTAKVADQLGNNQLAVLIKNALFTLSLPPGANPSGDTLNLKVVSLSPALTFAMQEGGKEASLPQDGSVAVKLSVASRYLTTLLNAGDSNAAVNSGKTLQLDAGAQKPEQLAKQLQQDVKQSGLFYESHLKDFSNGLHALEQLKQEPQAKLTLSMQALDDGQKSAAAKPQLQELGHLVQRQLDGLEQRNVQLQGLAWPGQPMQMEIQREPMENERKGDGSEDIPVWSTSLSLNLPALGGMGVRVRLVGQSVQVSFKAEDDDAGQLIRQHATRLRDGMAAAGLTLAGLAVNQNEPAAE
ncbi:flagellar hook-length control protein FliK [Chromobacterium alticapitis]|uniref:Flagellar hook-length control protein FliK n=1 Tax=Chromobacterium alticapitis TaxID=2073169 RepID=A0A2S5DHX0_9NEIS|nr:flagellar hook-length control protein FliK [Chromobacterium alticapitis]POZ62629.1 flagellar hook-length control protein FliK [Chromobacterium alticapitis]